MPDFSLHSTPRPLAREGKGGKEREREERVGKGIKERERKEKRRKEERGGREMERDGGKELEEVKNAP